MKKVLLSSLAALLAGGYVYWGVLSAEDSLARTSLVLLLVLFAILAFVFISSGDALNAVCLLVLAASYDLCKAIKPPLPASLVALYVGFAFLALLIFVSIEAGRIASCGESWARFLTENRFVLPRLAAGVMVLGWVGVASYSWAKPTVEPPVALRVIHPAPPASIDVKGKKHELARVENPFRADKENFAKWTEEGKTLYYQNCFYCHGDTLNGKGHFASAFNPLPANFVDVGTIAMLQESFVFWRVAKGGPGLPKESAPWSSAMPRWEDMLTEDDLWKVVLYIYEGTGHQPRTWEEH